MHFSYIDIIIDNVFDEFSCLKVLKIESIITIGLVIIEKYKSEVGQNFLVWFG